MNVSPELPGTPLKALVSLCCFVAVFVATPARASVVEIPATITGHVEQPSSKHYGLLAYGRYFVMHTQIWYRAFLKFDLDSLPDTCAFISAELNYCQYAYNGGWPRVTLRLISDPVPLGADEIFWSMDGARTLAPERESQDGWVEWRFDTAALSALDSCRRTGSGSFGVHYPYDMQRPAKQAVAYGYDGQWPPYLRIVYIGPYETDIQAVRAELLTYPMVAGGSQSDTALLVLTNRGLVTSDYFWAYATAPGFAPESTLVGVVAVGETVSVRMPLPAPGTANSHVYYTLRSACLNDPWNANDTAKLRCWVFPRGTYTAAGFDGLAFPPPGWVIVNNDGGNQCWQWRADSGMSHSGDGFTMCVHEQTRPNDDWLISGPICPKPDDRDSVGFFSRAYQTAPTVGAQVWAMRGQSIIDTIRRLMSTTVAETVYNRRSMSLDTFDGDTIYVGFRCRSQGDWNGLCLDDVWFSSTYVPGTCEPQGSVVRQPKLGFAPNPATGRFVTVQYNVAAGTHGRLTLRDVLGRTVKSFTLDPSGSARLDLRGFAPGIYMATLDAAGQSISRKLILTAR